MKKIITTLILGLILTLGACGNQGNTAYNQAMKEGFDAVTTGNYDHAATAFGKALATKKEDRQATALLAHTRILKSAQESLDQGNYDKAIHSADLLINQSAAQSAVLTKAQAIKNAALQAEQGQAAASQVSTGDSGSGSSSSDTQSGGQAAGNSVQSSANGSVSGSSQPSGSSMAQQVTRAEAEAAVAKAAGYSPDQVYTDTTDQAAYYSIELRENHHNDSVADPNTAPVIGFFRYYKDSGRITKLDMVSNTYKYVN